MRSEEVQKNHYDRIQEEYAAHYFDLTSEAYREEFISKPLLEGIDLSNRNVLVAMCGAGAIVADLLAKGAQVTGLDISAESIRQFQTRWPGCQALCRSILKTGIEDETFDCVIVEGAIHHLHPQVPEGLEEIHRILKKGGYLCFVEPHKGSLIDGVRKTWYRFDPYFAENEASLDLEKLKKTFASRFAFKKEKYSGNVAYLFVLQSMIFRVPLAVKKYYSPALLRMEKFLNRFQGKRFSCFVSCQWQKKC